MSDEQDPEVIADLQLRARSEHDRTRTGAIPWTPPKIHSKVPCRGRCGALVDWPEDAEERFVMFNRMLASKAEAPLDKTRIVFCNPCRARGEKERAVAIGDLHVKVRDAIRELKGGCKEDRERELLLKLEKVGHPDIAGLRQWLADNKNKGNRRVARGAF